jgi:SAM-dependent methyltransferase
MQRQVSPKDIGILKKMRKNIADFMTESAEKYDRAGARLLDIAPHDHEGAAAYFHKARIDTLDINPESGTTYIADLTKNNRETIKTGTYDIMVCTEVLEHTLNPFAAVKEIKRLLRGGGVCLVSTPFMFRIHGPLPDCWRFSVHGLRELFRDFNILKIEELEDTKRFLAPFQYTLVAQKGKLNGR